MRATFDVVKITSKVQDGKIEVDLPEGTPVTILVDEKDYSPVPIVYLDDNGNMIITPEHEAELVAAEEELDRGEGVPWEVLRAELQAIRSKAK